MRGTAFLLLLATSAVLRAQAPTVLLADYVNLRNAAMTHDGSSVFFAGAPSVQGGTNIYRADVTGSSKITLPVTSYPPTTLFSGVSALAYPGSGARLAYSYLPDNGSQDEEIHVVNVDGTGDRRLVTDRDGCVRILCVDCYSTCVRNVHMSPDGNVVLYGAARSQPFYAVRTDGSGSQRLGIFDGTFAPSGQRVISQTNRAVFTSAAPLGPTLVAAATDVYLMDLDGSNLKRVTTYSSAASVASHAVISATGDWIAFALAEASKTQVWIVRSDGTGLRRLSDGTTDATAPSISADGSVVTFLQNGQVRQVTGATAGADVTRFVVSSPKGALLSGDGRRVGILLGPPSGFNAGIYLADARSSSTLSQLLPIFAPRLLFPNGILSAGGTAPPSIGSLLTAYGVNLTTEEFSVAQQFPLPTVLGNVSLTNDTVPLPLQAVTPWQINAQLPQTLRPGTISLRVKDADGTVSPDARTVARATAPEAIPIYGVGSANSPLAAAVYPGTKTLADTAHPAAAGDALEIYSLGLGVTTPRVDGGVASPLATADVKPRLRVGTVEAEITFYGLVPGLAGVYQVNIKVPSGLAPGYQLLRWINADGSLTGTTGIYVR